MKILTSIIIILSPLFAIGIENPNIAFGDNERLTYVVSYHAKLVPNTEVAEVVFKTTRHDSTNTYFIHANGKVFPFYKWFFDLNDTYTSVVDAATLRPLKSTCELREGKYKFSSRFMFDWQKNIVKTSYRNHKRPDESHKTMPLTPNSHDGLTLFYNLRSTDIKEFKEGEDRILKMVLDDTIRILHYKYLGRETKKIKGQGEFKTLKFSCMLVTSTEQSFEDGSEFTLWISDDKNKIPLYIESPIKVGSIRARLTSYSGLKYPLDSKLK